MTRHQKRYLEAIRSFMEKEGRSPQFLEIARMMGVTSRCTVHKAVHSLMREGVLVARKGKAGRIIDFKIVPQKMHSLNSCNRQHVPVWYMTPMCPMCEILRRQILTGKVEAVAL